jgi:NAD(P)H-dependent FMN reductase
MKLTGISGSLSRNSKTELAVRTALNFAESARPDIETELIALSEYDLVFCDGRNPDSDVLNRLEKLSDETVRLAGLLIQTYTGPSQPDIKRESLHSTQLS